MNDKEFVAKLKNQLIDITDLFLEFYDCCGIEREQCKAGDPNPCCTGNTIFGLGCEHLSKEGCIFINLDCKLWLCNTAIESTDLKCIDSLKMLENIAKNFGLIRRPYLGDPYTGADRR